MSDWQMLVEKWDGSHNFPRFNHDDGKPPGPKRVTTTLKYLGRFAASSPSRITRRRGA